MAHESIILELRSSSDWDGVTATALSRDDATVVGKRYFKFDLSGAHGYLEADLGGLFSPVSAKLVGIAYSSWNPMSRARVPSSSECQALARREWPGSECR